MRFGRQHAERMYTSTYYVLRTTYYVLPTTHSVTPFNSTGSPSITFQDSAGLNVERVARDKRAAQTVPLEIGNRCGCQEGTGTGTQGKARSNTDGEGRGKGGAKCIKSADRAKLFWPATSRPPTSQYVNQRADKRRAAGREQGRPVRAASDQMPPCQCSRSGGGPLALEGAGHPERRLGPQLRGPQVQVDGLPGGAPRSCRRAP